MTRRGFVAGLLVILGYARTGISPATPQLTVVTNSLCDTASSARWFTVRLTGRSLMIPESNRVILERKRATDPDSAYQGIARRKMLPERHGVILEALHVPPNKDYCLRARINNLPQTLPLELKRVDL